MIKYCLFYIENEKELSQENLYVSRLPLAKRQPPNKEKANKSCVSKESGMESRQKERELLSNKERSDIRRKENGTNDNKNNVGKSYSGTGSETDRIGIQTSKSIKISATGDRKKLTWKNKKENSDVTNLSVEEQYYNRWARPKQDEMSLSESNATKSWKNRAMKNHHGSIVIKGSSESRSVDEFGRKSDGVQSTRRSYGSFRDNSSSTKESDIRNSVDLENTSSTLNGSVISGLSKKDSSNLKTKEKSDVLMHKKLDDMKISHRTVSIPSDLHIINIRNNKVSKVELTSGRTNGKGNEHDINNIQNGKKTSGNGLDSLWDSCTSTVSQRSLANNCTKGNVSSESVPDKKNINPSEYGKGSLFPKRYKLFVDKFSSRPISQDEKLKLNQQNTEVKFYKTPPLLMYKQVAVVNFPARRVKEHLLKLRNRRGSITVANMYPEHLTCSDLKE